MKKINLHSLNSYALGNEDVYGLARTTVETAMPHKEKFNTALAASLQRLDERSTSLGARLKLAQYKSLTKKITTLNRECDRMLSELRNRTSVAINSIVDLPLAEKAIRADSFLLPYKNINRLPQNSQFQLTAEMLQKLAADEELTAIFTELGHDKVIAALTVKNSEFAHAWTLRNDLIGDQKELETASATKRETVKDYNLFCNQLFNQYIVAPDDSLHALISDINGIRAKYSAIVAAAKTRRADEIKSWRQNAPL